MGLCNKDSVKVSSKLIQWSRRSTGKEMGNTLSNGRKEGRNDRHPNHYIPPPVKFGGIKIFKKKS